MSKYKKQQNPSAETIDEATRIARATQRPKQTKEQSKLIALGIQKGIAEYKKQQKGRVRELGRLKKKLTKQYNNQPPSTEEVEDIVCNTQWLPWLLLAISWLLMGIWLLFSR